ncbi:hypothetical protein TNCV_541751 [Trichonephila clavipes]|nr:hypothetical protein TNCV_541751 [Trichonephila clavipes]
MSTFKFTATAFIFYQTKYFTLFPCCYQIILIPSTTLAIHLFITSTVSPTVLSDAKENIKQQPSQAHCPRKISKKTDFKKVKPTTNSKDIPIKNTTLKTAREKDSPNETSPVSKKSRRRKTFKTSDAMDTDANPSDSDYVIGLASDEDESLLEADFKKVADNPLTGPLSPSSHEK